MSNSTKKMSTQIYLKLREKSGFECGDIFESVNIRQSYNGKVERGDFEIAVIGTGFTDFAPICFKSHIITKKNKSQVYVCH